MTWSSILCIVIATVVLVLLIWGVNKLALWISVKFEGTKFAQISLKVSSVITRAVKATYQTYVQGIKVKTAVKQNGLLIAKKLYRHRKQLLKNVA